MSSVIIVGQDSDGRLDQVEIQQKGRSILKAQYVYVEAGLSIHIQGNKTILPTPTDLLGIIDKKFSMSALSVFNPSTGKYETQRTATTFKYLSQLANNPGATIWTPAKGKKFRLLGGLITLTTDAACAGEFWISLEDGANGGSIVRIEISKGPLVATGDITVIPITLPGNGYLSKGAGYYLGVYLNANLTGGYVSANVWGTEE